MDDMIVVLAAGALIPLIAIFVKSIVIDRFFERTMKELILKSSDGKIKKFMVKANASESEVKEILDSELYYEEMVKKSINKYINSHKKFNLSLHEGKHIDFLLENQDSKIGIEAKASIENFKSDWLKNYFEENKAIDELIFIANSKISESLIKEMNNLQKDYRLKFISSPNGKNLNKTIENVLDTEFNNKGLNKASKGTQ